MKKEFKSEGAPLVSVYVEESRRDGSHRVNVNWEAYMGGVEVESARVFLNALRRAINYAQREKERLAKQPAPQPDASRGG